MTVIEMPNPDENTRRKIDQDPKLAGYFEELRNALAVAQDQIERYKGLSITDDLTQLHNYRYLDEALKMSFEHAVKSDLSISLLMIDIDNFKSYNDTYGHPNGNSLLKKMGDIVRKSVRPDDLPFRYGGEEFCIIMPDTGMAGAYIVAERIRGRTEELYSNNEAMRLVTVSGGLSAYPNSIAESTFALVAGADEAMYRAKGSGKNVIMPTLEEIKLHGTHK